MAILLVRHGETAFNAARTIQFPDTPLNDRGLKQAERVGERLREHAVASILSSDYARARMTAEAIARHSGAAITFEVLLRERDFGDLRGRSYPELGYDFHALDFHPPNGESWDQFHGRVGKAWNAVTAFAENTQGNLAVVSHALVCRSVLSRQLESKPEIEASPPRWPNTGLTIIEGPPWHPILVACGAHLDEGSADDDGARA